MINLTYWLRKTPQPVTVLADDKRIEVPKNARAWKDLTKTIQSLEATKLVALNGQGEVIRSITLESEDDDKAPASPEMSDLQLFAKLLAEGYDKGMKANQPVIDSAMKFVETQAGRLMKAENEIERLRAHIHKLNIQIAQLNNAPEPAGEDSIMGALMAGAMQAAGGPLAVVGKGVAKK
jgi:hypothetical protein